MDPDLVNLVANAAYVHARDLDAENARSKNWRRLLVFPNVRQTKTLELRLKDNNELSFHALRDEVSKALSQDE
jgi:hypothetical protein